MILQEIEEKAKFTRYCNFSFFFSFIELKILTLYISARSPPSQSVQKKELIGGTNVEK